MMFLSSFLPVVCRRAHVLYTLFVFIVSNTYGVVFLLNFLRLVYHVLPVSLDWSFLIAPSVLSYVYLY